MFQPCVRFAMEILPGTQMLSGMHGMRRFAKSGRAVAQGQAVASSLACKVAWLCLVCVLLTGQVAKAGTDDPAAEAVVPVLVSRTVTVRITCPDEQADLDTVAAAPLATRSRSPSQQPETANSGDSANLAESANRGQRRGGTPQQVVVCTGICLGNGHLITLADVPTDSVFRITLPDGTQAQAIPRVYDHYSRLWLLTLPEDTLPELPLAKEPPPVGATVFSAAAEGIDPPAVSAGSLAAVGRFAGNTGFPPLLKCDLRTTGASNGAPLMNTNGELTGVITLAIDAEEHPGWAYAVPVSHVARLLSAQNEKMFVELKPVTPGLGITLGPGSVAGEVVVERVDPAGPASAADIQVGDVVVAAEGRKVRNAVQVVGLVLGKQPGESFELTLRRNVNDAAQEVVAQVTLAGEESSMRRAALQKGVIARRVPDGIAVQSNGRQKVVKPDADAQAENDAFAGQDGGGGAAPPGEPADRVAELEQTVSQLQAELLRQQKLIEALLQQVRQLQEAQTPPQKPPQQ